MFVGRRDPDVRSYSGGRVGGISPIIETICALMGYPCILLTHPTLILHFFESLCVNPRYQLILYQNLSKLVMLFKLIEVTITRTH